MSFPYASTVAVGVYSSLCSYILTLHSVFLTFSSFRKVFVAQEALNNYLWNEAQINLDLGFSMTG